MSTFSPQSFQLPKIGLVAVGILFSAVVVLLGLVLFLSDIDRASTLLSKIGLGGILPAPLPQQEVEHYELQPTEEFILVPSPVPEVQRAAPAEVQYNSMNLPQNVMLMMQGVIVRDPNSSLSLRLGEPIQPADNPTGTTGPAFVIEEDLVFTSDTGYRMAVSFIELFEPLISEVDAYLYRPVELQGVVRHATFRASEDGPDVTQSTLYVRVIRVLE